MSPVLQIRLALMLGSLVACACVLSLRLIALAA